MAAPSSPIHHRFGMHLGGGAVLTGALLIGAVLVPIRAEATPTPPEHKVTICHRTNSVTNPYTVNPVDISSVDGSLGTGENDHTHHSGLAFNFSVDPEVQYPPPRNGDQWGDIIPPYQWGDTPEESFPGMNWDAGGQATWRADCVNPATTTTASTTTTTEGTTTTTEGTTTTTEGTTTTTVGTTTTTEGTTTTAAVLPTTTTTVGTTTTTTEGTTTTTVGTTTTAAVLPATIEQTTTTAAATTTTLGAIVLGETIVRNALAATGVEVTAFVALGAVLIGLGLALMVATRRRQRAMR